MFTRSGCTLCDEAVRRLRLPARVLRLEIELVDVDTDAGLAERFGDGVPVITSGGGVELAEGRVSPGEAWLAAWRARRL